MLTGWLILWFNEDFDKKFNDEFNEMIINVDVCTSGQGLYGISQ
jgi:hypothetical protein